MAKYKLTPEGESYLKNGLPERNLLKLLDSFPGKSAPLEVASKSVGNFHIALKWVLEKGWVAKEGDRLALKILPEKTEEEESLEKIGKGEEASEDMLKILTGRNLVSRITETYERAEEAIRKSGNMIEDLTHDIVRTGLWKGRKFKSVEVVKLEKKIDFSREAKGNRQPYNKFLHKVRNKLVELGFKEMKGPTIETEFWNFDALFQPQNHPARDWTQTFSLKRPKLGSLPDKKIVDHVKETHENGWITGGTGWKYKWDPRVAMKLMPRAHGTALSARQLTNYPAVPGKYFAMARCYRPDIMDFKHGIEFNQTEGIVIGDGLTFKNLLGVLKMFATEIAGTNKVKFMPDYYPFTEYSCQLSALHPDLGWIEFGGSGLFREEVTRPLGIDVPVLAWGIGIDRLAMFELGIKDIRQMFSQNLEWLRGGK